MKLSDIDFQSIRDLTGVITSLKDQNSDDDFYCSFSSTSKKELSNLLTTGRVSRDNQDLFIDTVICSREFEKALIENQSPWIKTDYGYAYTTQSVSHPRFSATLTTLVNSKKDTSLIYAVEVNIRNFSLDFSQAKKTDYEDGKVMFENVGMTVYLGGVNAKILE